MMEGLCKVRYKKQGYLNTSKIIRYVVEYVVSLKLRVKCWHTVGNWPPVVMYSQVDVHRYSVTNM